MTRVAVAILAVVVLGAGLWLALRPNSDSGDDDRVLAWSAAPQHRGPPHPLGSTAHARALANALQPTIIVQASDGFWPVSLLSVFRQHSAGRTGVCPGSARDREGRHGCAVVSGASLLPWSGGSSDAFLDYPASSRDRDEQRRSALASLGLPSTQVTDAQTRRTARVYFYATPGAAGTVGVQYWFFYAYNYEPIRTHGITARLGGLHEGDFEHMAVLLSRDRKPVYVWLARHDREGQRFAWEEGALQREGPDSAHLRVYAARGSHATYESCGTKKRTSASQIDAWNVANDTIACDARAVEFTPQTPLINLAMTSWTCWQGRFGYSPHFADVRKYLFADGPAAPLRQQRYPRRVDPCAGVPAPRAHREEREEAPGSATALALQRRGGSLSGLFNGCSDWEQLPPNPSGGYVVACADGLLHRFTASGLTGDETTRGTCLRLVTPTDGGCRDATVPAVYHAPDRAQLDGLRLTADRAVQTHVFAAVRDRDRLFEATFDEVALRTGVGLRLDRHRKRWALVDDAGGTVAVADMRTTRVVVKPPVPGQVEARRAGADVAVSFVAPSDRSVRYQVAAAPTHAALDDGDVPSRLIRPGGTNHQERRLGSKRVRYALTLPAPGATRVRVVSVRDGASERADAVIAPG